MDKVEAKQLLQEQVNELKTVPYGSLRRHVDTDFTDPREIKGASGTVYHLETHAVWHNKNRDQLRIIATIHAGGWRAVFPVTQYFVMRTDGTITEG